MKWISLKGNYWGSCEPYHTLTPKINFIKTQLLDTMDHAYGGPWLCDGSTYVQKWLGKIQQLY